MLPQKRDKGSGVCHTDASKCIEHLHEIGFAWFGGNVRNGFAIGRSKAAIGAEPHGLPLANQMMGY